jgi:hypothetical protein
MNDMHTHIVRLTPNEIEFLIQMLIDKENTSRPTPGVEATIANISAHLRNAVKVD